MKKMSYPRFLARAAMTLLAVFCCLTGARAQETVEIGSLDGAGNNSYLPMNSLYEYSYTQQIYTAEEIGMAGTINSITMYLYGNADLYEMPFDIYMVETDKEAFASTTDWVSVSESDIVYSGTVTVHNTEAEAYTFELNTPFVYSGQGNLLIAFNNKTGQWKGGLNGKVFGADGDPARAIHARQDDNGYDPTNPTFTANSTTYSRNVIQLEITPSGDVQICARPSTFEVSDITTTGATFEWEDTGAGSYSFEYKKASDTEWTTVSVEGVGRGDASIKTYTLLDLDPGTDYNARVKAICGTDSESGYKTLNFNTYLCTPEDMCAINISLTDSYGDGWNGGKLEVVDVETGRVLGSYTIPSGNSAEYTLNVCDGRAINIVYTQGSYPTENGWVVTDIFDEVISEHAGGSGTTAATTGVQATYNVNCTPPACLKPTGVTVNYEGGTEATVTWQGDASAYNIDYNGTQVTGITGNSYALTGLELGTTYEVKVQAVCSDTEISDWTNAVSFKTDNCMPEDMCSLTFTVTDSYGDGWNGASIVIYDYTDGELGELLATVTNQNLDGLTGSSQTEPETQTYTLNFCNGQELVIGWSEGNYDDECSYTITDINGEIVAQDDTELAIPYTIDCTVTDCRRPTGFAASEIGPHSVELSWTENGEATAWVIAYMSENDEDFTEITVTENPYTLEGLDPETMYYAQVSPVCEVDKPSEVISWTTTVAAPAPTDLSATPLVTTAEVSWNGFAESYELEYAEGIYGSGGWLQYDNGTYTGGIGNSNANTWTWGVMYPGSMVTGNQLTKVSIYETAQYNTEDITINIYSGGDTAPGELLYTQTVTPEAADAFHEITLDSPVEITQGQNLWITLTEQGTYVLSYCLSDEPNNNWVQSDGSWAHVDDLSASLAGEGWMIRGEMASSNDPSTATWIPVENPSSPCTLEGLNPETTYTFRVRGNFGDEGMSDWAMSTFTTKVGTEDPIDLTAETTSTTATLDWTGYQESYNVKYRKSLADPTAPATIILTAPDMWDDGSGYQMLLDADATAYGTIIPETGGLTTSGDASADTYAEFEYKIPGNADGSLTTENIVLNNSVSIEIPAGTYDWCITNPTPEDRVWIAASNGNVGGRYDDFVFEPGVTYEFTISAYGTNDGVDLTETRPMGDWITVENVTNPYELEGLTPDTYYEWQVQGIIDDATTTDWVSDTFTTLPLIKLANDATDNSTLISDNKDAVADVTLAGRTLFKDGSWNTLCLPFDVTDGDDSDDLTFSGTPLEGATAKELTNATMTGTHVTLTFDDVTELEAGKPYIIKWAAAEENISEPTFTGVLIQDVAEADRTISPIPGVKFIGYYDAFGIDADDENIYYMTASNELKHTGKARTLKACRAYFEFSEAATAGGVREFTLNFGDSEATGIVSIDNEQLNNESGWYTVDGKKLDKQPKRKGVYINNGIKVVIK